MRPWDLRNGSSLSLKWDGASCAPDRVDITTWMVEEARWAGNGGSVMAAMVAFFEGGIKCRCTIAVRMKVALDITDGVLA